MRSIALLAAAVVAAGAAPAAARAQAANDPAGDFLPTYVGPQGGDLDVLHVDFTLDGSFRFVSRSAANIGTTPGALFVWGVDRGQGTARFPTLAPGVLFDAVIAVNPLGVTNVTDILAGVTTALPVGAVSFSGADLTVVVPMALLPSRGLAADRYTANLWPRLGAGNNNQISDFAPNNSNILVTTPEPATALLVLPALGLAAAARRRRSA